MCFKKQGSAVHVATMPQPQLDGHRDPSRNLSQAAPCTALLIWLVICNHQMYSLQYDCFCLLADLPATRSELCYEYGYCCDSQNVQEGWDRLCAENWARDAEHQDWSCIISCLDCDCWLGTWVSTTNATKSPCKLLGTASPVHGISISRRLFIIGWFFRLLPFCNRARLEQAARCAGMAAPCRLQHTW